MDSYFFVTFSLVSASLFAYTHGATPVFVSPAATGSTTWSIDEGTNAGVPIYSLSATDADNGTIAYSIFSQSPGTKFRILSSNALALSSTIDFETDNTVYNLTIQASSGTNTSTAFMKIYITDINDEAPVIGGTFTATIDEEEPVGTAVGISYTVNDADAGDVLSYSLSGSTNFQIDSGTGAITISKVIDYDSGQTSFTFTLVVMDSANPAHSASQNLTITVRNINDNTPVFSPAVYYVSLTENTNAGFSVCKVNVTDKDTADNLTISIQSGDDSSAKFVANIDQIETSSTPIDYDVLTVQNFLYTLVVIGVDTGMNTGTATVFVSITGINDNPPTWTAFNPVYSVVSPYTVSENALIGTSIVTIAATDADAGVDGQIAFTIDNITDSSGVLHTGIFYLEDTTGILTLSTAMLDRDTATGGSQYYIIEVRATDKGISPLSTSRNITINIQDVNDNAPICSPSTISATVIENVAPGFSVLTVVATDADATAVNNVITYSITGGNGASTFVTNTSSGVMYTSGTIDYETATSYDIIIVVSDIGTPILSSTCMARIDVYDMNDNAPTFPSNSLSVTVPENVTIGTRVTVAQATDTDSTINNNSVIIYSFSPRSFEFTIDANTGLISTSVALDREIVSSYLLTVFAVDQGKPQRTGSVSYTVSVSDVNDNAPVISGTYDISVPETIGLNSVMFTITATDPDDIPNAVLSFAITKGNNNSQFSIDRGSGLVQVRQTLDRETIDLFQLEITVTDSGTPTRSATTTATVTIADVNDNPPVFSMRHYSFSVSEAATLGSSVDTVVASDNDIGFNAVITYSIAYFTTGDSTHFSITSNSGVINTASNLDRETQGIYIMVVRATDRGVSALTATATVTVSLTDYNDNTPLFSEGSYEGFTKENQAVGTSILSVSVADIDIGLNADVLLKIDTVNLFGARAGVYIAADSATSTLKVKQVIDRETESSFVFNLIATDQGTPPLSSTAMINITVGDINDNAPIFSASFYSSEIAYNDDCQGTVVTIAATDADIGLNAEITYSFMQNNYSGLFSLNGISGDIMFTAPAASDRTFILIASASDSGSPPLNSSTDAVIRIDTYDPNSVIVSYNMDINCSLYSMNEASFLTQLTAVYQTTYVSPTAKRWCVVETSKTTCAVRIYVLKDDTSDELDELANSKNYLTTDEAFAITATNTSGTPAPIITGPDWSMFAITKVEKFYTAPVSSVESSTSWVETKTGIIVMSSVGAAAFVAIVTGFSLAYHYKNKIPSNSRVGAVKGDAVPKKMFLDKYGSMPRVSVNDDLNTNSSDMGEKGQRNSKAKDKSVINVKNRQFNGRAFDQATGRVYEYDTKTGDKSWIRTPDGEPGLQF